MFLGETHKESAPASRLPFGDFDSPFAKTRFENKGRTSPNVAVGDVGAKVVNAASPMFIR